jgi:predicted RND superfamily exporter protein
MQPILSLVRRFPGTIVTLFLAAWIAAAIVHSRDVRFDFSFSSMAPTDTPEFDSYQTFVEHFGHGDEFFLLAFRDEPLLTPENLRLIRTLTERIELFRDTESVTSLTNVKNIIGHDDTLEIVEYVKTIPETAADLQTLSATLTGEPLILGNVLSRDAQTVAIVGRLLNQAGDPARRQAYFDELRALLAEVADDRVDVYFGGVPYMDQAMMTHIFHDTALFLPVTVATFGLILWLAFRRGRAVWIPLFTIGFAATATMGTLSLCGLPMTMLTQWGSLSTLILVIALSDAVHLMNRYEEDLTLCPDRETAIGETVVHLGHACFLTTLTTGIGFLALAATKIPTIRHFGIFGALGIFYAFAVTILFLPAALILIDRRWPARPWPPHTHDRLDSALAATATFVTRHRTSLIAASVVLLAASAFSAGSLQIDNRFTRDFKRSDPAVQSQDFLEEHFGGTFALEVLVEGGAEGSVKDPELLAAIDHLQTELETHPRVTRVLSPVEFIEKMNQAMHGGRAEARVLPRSRELVAQYLLLFDMAGSDADFNRLVNYNYSIARLAGRLEDITPAEYREIEAFVDRIVAERFPPGVHVQLSGSGPLFTTVTERLISSLLRSLAFALPVIFVIIALTFRSIPLGLLSTLPNLLPLTLALGLMPLTGITLKFSTIIAFPIAFGIAVDDTIHFLARYRDELHAGAEPPEAVRRTMRTAGRAMVLTTLLLIGGWVVMFTSSWLGPIHLSVIAIIILAGALFGDLFVLPALLLTFRPRVS